MFACSKNVILIMVSTLNLLKFNSLAQNPLHFSGLIKLTRYHNFSKEEFKFLYRNLLVILCLSNTLLRGSSHQSNTH